ncbi:hypothetical protein TWF481_002250 [Arthrobotrys musiformis]|uniref:Uncharacterized protein n=1 Tax=Arthrobotrys musiformis TaxID=47236 RepID=A0AAV9VUJ3_9PEZI
MQFTTVLLSILASTTLITAAPVPEPGIPAIVGGIIGIGCAFFSSDCGKVGDAAKEGFNPKEFVNRKMEGIHTDNGVSAGMNIPSFFGKGPGGFKKE